jgi:hypothetical protein
LKVCSVACLTSVYRCNKTRSAVSAQVRYRLLLLHETNEEPVEHYRHGDEDRDEIEPLLVALSIERTGSDDLPGRYCPERHVWVVDSPDGPQPLVTMAASAELITFTKVKGERTDAETSVILAPELVTKTDVMRERDDK